MIANSTENIMNSEAPIVTEDKPQIESLKPIKERHLLTDTGNTSTELPGESTPKSGVLDVDSAKAGGIKRHISDCSPFGLHKKSTSNGCISEHLVYTRRKLETEHGKSDACVHLPTNDFAKSKNGLREKKQSDDIQDEKQVHGFSPYLASHQTGSPTVSSRGPLVSYSFKKPTTSFPSKESNEPSTNGAPILVSYQETNDLHWKERFLRVQAFLRACDLSTQDDYIQMLRSLSPLERSKHAVDLEKRAIHLLLEEGKELHLMKVLNVFGKASPMDEAAAVVAKSPPPQVTKEES